MHFFHCAFHCLCHSWNKFMSQPVNFVGVWQLVFNVPIELSYPLDLSKLMFNLSPPVCPPKNCDIPCQYIATSSSSNIQFLPLSSKSNALILKWNNLMGTSLRLQLTVNIWKWRMLCDFWPPSVSPSYVEVLRRHSGRKKNVLLLLNPFNQTAVAASDPFSQKYDHSIPPRCNSRHKNGLYGKYGK